MDKFTFGCFLLYLAEALAGFACRLLSRVDMRGAQSRIAGVASTLRNGLRSMRQRLGLQQQDLASQIGVSRQTLTAIESGATAPSTAIALGLARVLQCRVEDIFSLDDEHRQIEAAFVAEASPKVKGAAVERKIRVALGQVGARWVARPLDGDPSLALGTPADGIASVDKRTTAATVRVRPLRDVEALRRNLLVAGCDPALGLLGRHLEERLRGPRLHWIDLASHAALDELAADRVHVAGLHLDDLDEGNRNAATVAQRFRHRSMVLVTLASWELGMVYRPDRNAPRTVADLARKGLRVIGREPGAGAQQLLESALRQAQLTGRDLDVVALARGHRGVAQMVASGAGDVGIATQGAALALGLGFRPIAETRFDLAFQAELATDARMQSLLDCLSTQRFRADLGAMTGYRTSKTGNTVGESVAEK
jgi:putative molybdopterin biosynthesis protein